MNKYVAKPVNFVRRNERKFVYTALAVTTVGTVLMFRNQRVTNEFLASHNLLDAFYAVEELV